MNSVYVFIAAVVLLAFAIWLVRKSARDEGVSRERADNVGKVLDGVEKAKRARDRLWTDPDVRRKLREQYRP